MWPRILLAPFALVPALTLAQATPSVSPDTTDSPATSAAPSGASGEASAPIYFGVGAGPSKFDDDDQFRHQKLDNSDFGYKLQIGAYFTPRFAVEFGYRNYGKFDFEIGATGESGDVETWATTLAGILSVSLTSNLYLTPRLGVASLRFEQSLPLSRIQEPALLAGAGLRLRLSKHLEVEGLLESIYYELEGAEVVATDGNILVRERDLNQLLTMLSLNAHVRF